jgi:hypothetical protein
MFWQKKIMAFVMLLLVAASLFLLVGFIVKQKIIQHHMLEQLENASLQTITVNKADIAWIKKNKEVIIDEKLFDVKFYTICGDKIILTGLFDAAENKLKKEFANLIQQKKNDPAPLEQMILKLIFLAVINQNQQTETSKYQLTIKAACRFYNEVAVSQVVSTPSPPPNV